MGWALAKLDTEVSPLNLTASLCDLIDGSPPGFPVPGILKARTLEWVAISFSNACSSKLQPEALLSLGKSIIRHNPGLLFKSIHTSTYSVF